MTCSPWSKVLLEMENITYSKFPPFCGTWRFICHFYSSLPFVPILSWRHSVHVLLSCFLKIHFNIVFPSVPRSSKWLNPSGLLIKFYMCMSSALAYHPTITVFGKQYKLWRFQFWSLFILISLLPLREKYSSQYYVVKHHQSYSYLNVCEEVLYLYKNR